MTHCSVTGAVVLTNAAVQHFARGERWFSERDVVGRKPRLPGIARLYDRRRSFLGQAFCSPGARPYLRLIARTEEAIDKEWWRRCLCKASERRACLFPVTDAFRVVHAESDGIPGVTIDCYNDIWAIQVTCAGAESITRDLIDIIIEEFAPVSIVEKDAVAVRASQGLPLVERVVHGERTRALVREGDQRFEVDVLTGQKTGAYLDYRALRLAARRFARGRCLDAFCYQGWFSCQIAVGAREVIAVDASAAAVAAAEENAARNGHANAKFLKGDVFDALEDLGAPFDFVHLDPPSFAKGGGKLAQALSGYRKLLRMSLPLIAPGGTLMISACSHAITERILEQTVLEAIVQGGRRGNIVYRGIQDIDHPVLRGHPESLYLKGIAVVVE